MGLAISVGVLADLKDNDEEGFAWAQRMFAQVNEFLEDNGVDGWAEPHALPDLRRRPHLGSFPYSFLHYLRRAYAHASERPGEPLAPTGEGGLTAEDEFLIDDASSMMCSHLLCHSDCDGLYVPVRFAEPLFDLDDAGLPGGMLGSSYALLDELRVVAPYIGVALEGGELSDAEAQRLYATDDSNPWDREHVVFLALWEAATASVTHGTAIVFN